MSDCFARYAVPDILTSSKDSGFERALSGIISVAVVRLQIANFDPLEFPMTTSFRLTPQMHLRRPQDFERVYGSGERAGDGHLLVFAFRNKLDVSRAGLSVSKKHGSAVRRNVKRRRLREAFRLLQHDIPIGMDLILIPRQRDDSTLADFQASLKSIANRLARKLFRPPQTQLNVHPDPPPDSQLQTEGDGK